MFLLNKVFIFQKMPSPYLFSIEHWSKYIKITGSRCLQMKQFKGEMIFGLNLLFLKRKAFLELKNRNASKKIKKEEDKMWHCEG